MSELQKEIKQSVPFESLEQEVFLNLERTAYAIRQRIEGVLREGGIGSQQQYNVLRILRGAGKSGLTCQDIGSRMITKDSDITRLLARLSSSGLINQKASKSDRRVKIATITEKGIRLVDSLRVPVQAEAEERLGHLGSELLEELNALLVLARKKAQYK